MRSDAFMSVRSDLRLDARAGQRTSRTRVVLPEPLTPVTHTKRFNGISTDKSLRLFLEAWDRTKVGQASRLPSNRKGASFKTNES